MHNTNPNQIDVIQVLDQPKTFQKSKESEWLLNFLRTEGSVEPQKPTDEQLLVWQKALH
jgi:hypothetical protein